MIIINYILNNEEDIYFNNLIIENSLNLKDTSYID